MKRKHYRRRAEAIRRMLRQPSAYRRIMTDDVSMLLVNGVRYIVYMENAQGQFYSNYRIAASMRPDKGGDGQWLIAYNVKSPFRGLFEQRATADSDNTYRPTSVRLANVQTFIEHGVRRCRHRGREWCAEVVADELGMPVKLLRDTQSPTRITAKGYRKLKRQEIKRMVENAKYELQILKERKEYEKQIAQGAVPHPGVSAYSAWDMDVGTDTIVRVPQTEYVD